MALEHELAVFRARLSELLGPGDVHEGKWVVIKGDDARWPCADFDAALADGYERHGVTDFLVKQIERVETVHHFSRDLGPRSASADALADRGQDGMSFRLSGARDYHQERTVYPPDDSVLDRLRRDKVFSVGFRDTGEVVFRDGCDEYFISLMSLVEIRQLAEEMIRLQEFLSGVGLKP